MNININLENTTLSQKDVRNIKKDAERAYKSLLNKNMSMTGWINPIDPNSNIIHEIIKTAEKVNAAAEVMIVVGIGGSNLGAKAVIDTIDKNKIITPIFFTGTSLCSYEIKKAINLIYEKDVVLCVISKSGNTLETKIVFETLRHHMKEKYHENTGKRIVVITGENDGYLRNEAIKNSYKIFPVPEDIGGRFSAFTPVVLFPMAVAGLDIIGFLFGAIKMSKNYITVPQFIDYAISRYLLQKNGYSIEAFEFYDVQLKSLGEWIKQLVGESEGKDGKGLFPAVIQIPAELHSMGQFLQQGAHRFTETAIITGQAKRDIIIPCGELKGFSFDAINKMTITSMIAAHKAENIPITELHIKDLSEYTIGQMMYFLMISVSISSLLNNINPFDQPGVEKYKNEMIKLLNNEFEDL